MACLSNKSLPPNVIEYAKISKNNAIVWILGSPKTKGFMIGHISDLLNWITNSFKWPLCLNPDMLIGFLRVLIEEIGDLWILKVSALHPFSYFLVLIKMLGTNVNSWFYYPVVILLEELGKRLESFLFMNFIKSKFAAKYLKYLFNHSFTHAINPFFDPLLYWSVPIHISVHLSIHLLLGLSVSPFSCLPICRISASLFLIKLPFFEENSYLCLKWG